MFRLLPAAMKVNRSATVTHGVAFPLVHILADKLMTMRFMRFVSMPVVLMMSFQVAKAQDPEIKKVPVPDQELKGPTIKNADTTIKKILDELQRVTDNDKQNSNAIQALLQGREIDNITKYELIKSNIVNASETYYLLNKK